ncbi:hypothetical protein [Mycoplasmopsis synoviae]|uniref:Lipoprotein n=1 Tax=Mycoplasmopsis synoviae TaxID=2109 RepID=A0AAX3F2Y7_MYCSY|nr:hypothetical protein [Mycoplasmopsis synoviae]UZW64752.1 hypothetical protein OIE46_01635 [Mycoplasmopsis synoviae]
MKKRKKFLNHLITAPLIITSTSLIAISCTGGNNQEQEITAEVTFKDGETEVSKTTFKGREEFSINLENHVPFGYDLKENQTLLYDVKQNTSITVQVQQKSTKFSLVDRATRQELAKVEGFFTDRDEKLTAFLQVNLPANYQLDSRFTLDGVHLFEDNTVFLSKSTTNYTTTLNFKLQDNTVVKTITLNLDKNSLLSLSNYVPAGYELVDKSQRITFNQSNDFVVKKVEASQSTPRKSDVINQDKVVLDQSNNTRNSITINGPAYILDTLNLSRTTFPSDVVFNSSFSVNGYTFLNVVVKSYDDALGTLSFSSTVVNSSNPSVTGEFDFNLSGLQQTKRIFSVGTDFNENSLYSKKLTNATADQLSKEEILSGLKSFTGVDQEFTVNYDLLDLIRKNRVFVNTMQIQDNGTKLNLNLDLLSKRLENGEVTETKVRLIDKEIDFNTGYSLGGELSYILNNKVSVASLTGSNDQKQYPSYYWGRTKKEIDLANTLLQFDPTFFNNQQVKKTTNDKVIQVKYENLVPNDLTGELTFDAYLVALDSTANDGNIQSSRRRFTVGGLNKLNTKMSLTDPVLSKFDLSVKSSGSKSIIANLVKSNSTDTNFTNKNAGSLFKALSFTFLLSEVDEAKQNSFWDLKFNNVDLQSAYDSETKLLKQNGNELFAPYKIEVEPISFSNYSLEGTTVKFTLNVNLKVTLFAGDDKYEFTKSFQFVNPLSTSSSSSSSSSSSR